MLEAELKEKILKLLKEDETFRYAVAGLIGLDEVLKRLDRREEVLEKLFEELVELREDFNKMHKSLRDVIVTLERLTLTEEEEAREVVGCRLEELGIKLALGRLELPELQVDIYGSDGDVCVIGEATVRLGSRIVEELEGKVGLLKSRYPEYIKPKLIKIIYTMIATKEALRRAEELRIWVLTWKEDLIKVDFSDYILP